MLMMMSPDKKDAIAGAIMEKFLGGKKVESNGPKEYSEDCKMAASELLNAIDARNVNGIISAIIALVQETEKFEG